MANRRPTRQGSNRGIGDYNRTTLSGASRRFQGSHHSTAHYSGISYGLGFRGRYGSWGVYGYPYGYGHYQPYAYCNGYNTWGAYWGSRYPNYGSVWWWPSYCYYPGRWSGYYYPYYYGYVGGYSPGYSSTIVYEVAAASEPVAEVEAVEETEEDRLARLTQRHLELGDFYFKQGRFEEAAESYMRALAYSPDDGSIHFVIADSLFAQGDYHYAAFMIKKALDLDPELAKAEVDKRSFYEDPTLFDRQMETLRKYLEEKPYDAAAHLVMGFNLRFSGDSSAAKLALTRVIEIDPGSRAAQVLLDSLTGARESASATPPAPAEPESRPIKK